MLQRKLQDKKLKRFDCPLLQNVQTVVVLLLWHYVRFFSFFAASVEFGMFRVLCCHKFLVNAPLLLLISKLKLPSSYKAMGLLRI